MSTTSSTMLWNQSGDKVIGVLASLIAIVFLFFIWTIVQVVGNAQDESEYLNMASELRVLSQQLAAHSRDSSEGKEAAFNELETVRADIQAQMEAFQAGTKDLDPLSQFLPSEVSDLSQVWTRLDADAQAILSSRNEVLFLHEVAEELADTIPELQARYDTVVEILIEGRASAEQVASAQKQTWRAERIARNVDKMLVGGEQADDAADQFILDASEFGEILNSMLNGNPAMGIKRINNEEVRSALFEVADLFEFITGSVDDIFTASPDLKKVSAATEKVFVDSPLMMGQTSKLTEKINDLESRRPVYESSVSA
ncbi:MAG: type IV pili methyl-accepting chemotaxis transducer N-terminal domain-containing protein, partial [Pseudomonadales bacterium]|nr:type IV pili methyl-accepting chemotaxis transducer N-terminal domain-containing protein [Pseudomonadales bacterium]